MSTSSATGVALIGVGASSSSHRAHTTEMERYCEEIRVCDENMMNCHVEYDCRNFEQNKHNSNIICAIGVVVLIVFFWWAVHKLSS